MCCFFVTPIAVEIEEPTFKLFSIVDGIGFLPSLSLNSSDETVLLPAPVSVLSLRTQACQ